MVTPSSELALCPSRGAAGPGGLLVEVLDTHSRWRHLPTLQFQPCLLPPLPKPWQPRVRAAVTSVWLWAKTQDGLRVELERLELQ